MTEVLGAEPAVVPITDNAVLDEFHVPFGEWMSQATGWAGGNFDWLLSALEWPFRVLIDNVVQGFLVGSAGEPNLSSWGSVALSRVAPFFDSGEVVRRPLHGHGPHSREGYLASGSYG